MNLATTLFLYFALGFITVVIGMVLSNFLSETGLTLAETLITIMICCAIGWVEWNVLF